MRFSMAALPLLLATFGAHGERDSYDVVAVVLDEVIRVADVAEVPIDSLINGLLLTRFAEDNGIEPTDAEIAAFTDWMVKSQEKLLHDFAANKAELTVALEAALDPEERVEIRERLASVEQTIELMAQGRVDTDIAVMRPVARGWVERWKISKALFDKYGGRAHYQQAGVQPFDAVREFLEEQEASGAFTILDKDYEDEFWAYWRRGHRFIPEEEAVELLATPFWVMDSPSDD